MQSSGRTRSRRQNDEPAERVSWTSIGYSSNDAVNSFLRDVDQIWKSTCELPNLKKIPDYRLSQTWVEASDGRAYKCVSMIDSRGNRLSTTDMQNDILARISAGYEGSCQQQVGAHEKEVSHSLSNDRFYNLVSMMGRVLLQLGFLKVSPTVGVLLFIGSRSSLHFLTKSKILRHDSRKLIAS